MGADSEIEWTDHTFNPWWGCVRVSPGCENCYAETFSKRVGQRIWGVDAPRRFFNEKHWAEPLFVSLLLNVLLMFGFVSWLDRTMWR